VFRKALSLFGIYLVVVAVLVAASCSTKWGDNMKAIAAAFPDAQNIYSVPNHRRVFIVRDVKGVIWWVEGFSEFDANNGGIKFKTAILPPEAR
jgi:hypothetical protein